MRTNFLSRRNQRYLMKYFFINVIAGKGSTGGIVIRQCKEILEAGGECIIAYGRDRYHEKDINTYRIASTVGVFWHGFLTRLKDKQGLVSKRSTTRLIKKIQSEDPDIIWLHNLHGYYLNYEILFDYLKGCGKEIHWTLHDCWAFTGHCAYFDYVNCQKWKTQCYECPQKDTYPISYFDGSMENYFRKMIAFTEVPNLTIHVVSNWLKTRVKQSFLSDYPVVVTYNEIDTKAFSPKPGRFKDRFMPTEKRMLLGVANVWESRKGLSDFIRLSSLIDDRYQILLIGLTKRQIRHLPQNIIGLTKTFNREELAQAYSDAFAFINPSVEETFGLTTAEAMACGVPVIVYKGTACEEVAGSENAVPLKDVPAIAAKLNEIAGEA